MIKIFFQLSLVLLFLLALTGCGDPVNVGNDDLPNDDGIQELDDTNPENTGTGRDVSNPGESTEAESSDPEIDSPPGLELPKVKEAQPGDELRSNLYIGSSDYTMIDFLTRVITDVDTFWSEVMVANGYTEPQVYYNFIPAGEWANHQSECIDESEKITKLEAFYCPFDDQIVFTEEMAQGIWAGEIEGQNERPNLEYVTGDFSVAFAVAHEFSHSLQAELGWLNTVKPAEGQRYERIVETTATENHADCLAGVWANSTYHRGLLEAGDIEEAIRSLHDFGDDRIGLEKRHGSPDERITAFFAGYDSGSAAQCDHYLQDAYAEKQASQN